MAYTHTHTHTQFLSLSVFYIQSEDGFQGSKYVAENT